jgi:serine/threonine-protein kinase
MNRCPSCGLELAVGARFCPKDGSRLDVGVPSSPSSAHDALVGQVLSGRYLIQAKLGEGGMGAVYRAYHQGMDKALAIKVLQSGMSRDEVATKRFQREAKSASRLDHEHCIRVTDFGETDDGLLYLVMECLEGRTLARALYEEGPLPAARVVAITTQVCLALAHAHELGIVHRDLKPDNVFLVARTGPADFVKVLDFGLAKLLEREGDGSISTLTEAGTVFGTPEYMSPEQAEGKPLSERTDLYSLGIVMYQMLTGLLPFQAASFVGILSKHITDTAVAPCERRVDLGIPRALSDLVMRCLAKDPPLRPESAHALRQALGDADLSPAETRVPRDVANQATIDMPVHPLVTHATSQAAPKARRSERLLWAGLAIFIGLVGLALFLARDPPAPSAAAVATALARPDATVPSAVSEAAPVGPASTPALAKAVAVDDAQDPVGENLRLADKYRQKGNRIKELFHLQQAVAQEPENPVALYALGAALLSYGQDTQACPYLRRAFKLKRARTLYATSSCSLVKTD